MREIKFRVWDKDNKEMRYCGKDVHDSMHFVGGNAKFFNMQNGSGGEDYILMQYIGIKDSNEQEIYEGDIITIWLKDLINSGGVYQVKYLDTAFYLVEFDEKIFSGNFEYWLKCCKVEMIGNIHDNPELLKGEK